MENHTKFYFYLHIDVWIFLMSSDLFFECTFDALIVENIGWPGILFHCQFSYDFAGLMKRKSQSMLTCAGRIAL